MEMEGQEFLEFAFFSHNGLIFFFEKVKKHTQKMLFVYVCFHVCTFLFFVINILSFSFFFHKIEYPVLVGVCLYMICVRNSLSVFLFEDARKYVCNTFFLYVCVFCVFRECFFVSRSSPPEERNNYNANIVC